MSPKLQSPASSGRPPPVPCRHLEDSTKPPHCESNTPLSRQINRLQPAPSPVISIPPSPSPVGSIAPSPQPANRLSWPTGIRRHRLTAPSSPVSDTLTQPNRCSLASTPSEPGLTGAANRAQCLLPRLPPSNSSTTQGPPPVIGLLAPFLPWNLPPIPRLQTATSHPRVDMTPMRCRMTPSRRTA